MSVTDGPSFWVLSSETDVGTCDAMSFIGIYSSVEKAKAYLERWYLGRASFDALVWTHADTNAGFWEAHDPDHRHCFLVTRHQWGELDYGV